MIIAFMLATRPASAGGVPDSELSGVGGSASGVSKDQPIPTIMNKETLSLNSTNMDTKAINLVGFIISRDDTSMTLQTLTGQKKYSLLSNTVVKSNNEIISIESINRGDFLSATIDNKGQVLQMSKLNVAPGALQGLIALTAISAVGAGIATNAYLRKWNYGSQLQLPKKYYLR